MKTTIFSLAVVTVSAWVGVSCGSKPAGPQMVEGVVLDASMNNITLVTTAGDTLNISTMDADPDRVPGVLIDDSVKVTYADTTVNGVQAMRAQELTVTVHSPYYYIQGTWTEPNPIDTAAVQGFRLNADGTAASIGMETLLFENWNLADTKTLILSGKSVGNRMTIPMADTLAVDRLDADSLVLSSGAGEVMWRLGRR